MNFSSSTILATLSGPNWKSSLNVYFQQILTGDFNGDGLKDYIINRNIGLGEVADSPAFILQTGEHGFYDASSTIFSGSIPLVRYTPRIAVADFNKDNQADVYLPDFGEHPTNVDGNSVYPGAKDTLILSNGNGQLTNASNTLTSPTSLAHGVCVGDINNDGWTDVVVTDTDWRVPNVVKVLINDGTGHLELKSDQLLPAALNGIDKPRYTWPSLTDLNGDGYDDLVLGSLSTKTNPSIVLFNNGSGSFKNSTVYSLPKGPMIDDSVVNIQSTDLNGDNLKDLILSIAEGDGSNYYNKGYIQILINQGSGKFADETSSRYAQNTNINSVWWKFVNLVDMNNDGAKDMVLVASGPLTYSLDVSAKVVLNDGRGNFTDSYSLPCSSLAPDSIAVDDVNSDEKPDLVGLKWQAWDGQAFNKLAITALINDLPNGVHINANPTGKVTITGTATQRQVLTATNNIADSDGLGTVTYSWYASGSDSAIGTGSNYTLTQSEVGKTITAKASYTDSYGTSETVTSTATEAVVNVNDAPSGVDNTVNVAINGSYAFTSADFGFTDVLDGNSFSSVKISSLPALGQLKYNGTALTSAQVTSGYEVSAADLSAGKLVYAPVANGTGTAYSSFTFQVRDNGGTSNGGGDLDPTANTISFNVATSTNQVAGTSGNDNLKGTAGNDNINAGAGNDIITASLGTDTIDGGTGFDTIGFTGNYSAYTLTASSNGAINVSGASLGIDTVSNVERFQFKDLWYANDLNANNAAQVIYTAFGKDYVKQFLATGISLADSGLSLNGLCEMVTNNHLVETISGTTTTKGYVDTLFSNVVGRLPNVLEEVSFTSQIDSGALSRLSLLELAAAHSLTVASVDALKVDLIGIPYTPGL